MVIAAMEQTQLTFFLIGKDKTKWGNVKIKHYLALFTNPREPLCPSKRGTVDYRLNFR
jgi:hypothetical protein